MATISLIYDAYIQIKIKDEEGIHYNELAPVIALENIIKHFAYIREISYSDATKCIEFLIFDACNGLDLFSQPLVSVGDNKVILCPYLFTTFNIPRFVNQVLTKWNINLTEKGTNFEKNIRNDLSANKVGLLVTPNSLTIKDIQYDGLAILNNDCILIMEMKCLKRPYDQKEYYYAYEEILHAAKQLEIREENIKANFSELNKKWTQSKVVSNLSGKKIIKIIVLNIFDFTGLKVGDAYVTDYSSLEKFFLHPIVEEFLGNKLQKVHHLWKQKPSVEQFIAYLSKPIQTKYFIENLEVRYRPVLLIKEDDNRIQLFDLVLKSDLPNKFI